MNVRNEFTVLIVLLVALGALWGIEREGIAPDSASAEGASRTRADEQEWEARIQAVGGKTAYEELAQAIRDLPVSQQHENAHTFGAALFEAEGLEGLSVCDSRFSYGCFHEFMGKAISARGLGVVPGLNEGCRKSIVESPLSCQHGIGHGVQAFIGYGFGDLKEALVVCADLPYSDPIGGCYGGVFMEYNLQTMLGKDGKIRPPEDGDMQFPCNALPHTYTEACIFWQTQWWHQVLKGEGWNEDAIFTQIGQWCATQTGEQERTCFEGTGNITPPSADFDPARSAYLCERTSDDPKNRLFCKSYAANSLSVGGSGKTADGSAVCAGLSGNYRLYCEAYARNEANILKDADIPL
jgi:hypothetical protein